MKTAISIISLISIISILTLPYSLKADTKDSFERAVILEDSRMSSLRFEIKDNTVEIKLCKMTHRGSQAGLLKCKSFGNYEQGEVQNIFEDDYINRIQLAGEALAPGALVVAVMFGLNRLSKGALLPILSKSDFPSFALGVQKTGVYLLGYTGGFMAGVGVNKITGRLDQSKKEIAYSDLLGYLEDDSDGTEPKFLRINDDYFTEFETFLIAKLAEISE
ncbi:MAG: hypothetical protein KDD61_14830 [Bdellovibrionales bacterium]|nr:hypothetical protein [Bdellovibrionales bacterium]